MQYFNALAAAIFVSLILPMRSIALSHSPAAYFSAVPQGGETASTVVIAGTVHTQQGVAVPGARVRLLHVASGKAWETSTDDQGQFSVPDLPPGRYRIEAHQLGLGTTIWEDDIPGRSPDERAPQIELTFERTSPPAAVGNAGPIPHASASAKATQSGNKREAGSLPNEPSTEADQTPHRHRHHTAAVSEESSANAVDVPLPDQPANSNQAGTGKKRRGKSKNNGFEQVETSGILTANSEITQKVVSPALAAPKTDTQAFSSESYLISGAVGRAPTQAEAESASGSDDSTGADGTKKKSGKHHKHSHSHNRDSTTTKPFARANAPDNLSGVVADLAVRDTIKHLGSNQMHLTLYDYYDTSAWDASDYALTGIPFPKVAHFSERFGVNLGGPLTIPKLYNGKDRTFWFVNYELNRHTTPDDIFETVPTAPERSGNFCDRGSQLFDPMSNVDGPRRSFGCAIPSSRLDPTALKLVSLIPQPNLPGLVLNYHRGPRIPMSMDIVNFRALHSLSPRLSLVGIYNLIDARAQSITSFPSLNGNAATRNQNITLGLTQNWTPRFVNETKVNFNRNRDQVFSTNAFKKNVATEYGFTGISTTPIDYGVPQITFSNFAEIGDPAALLVRNQTLRFLDNVSYTLRRHTIRTGAEIRRRQLNTYTAPDSRGVYTFSGLMTSQLDNAGQSNPATGLDFADFLLGLPETTNVQFGTASNYGRSWQFISYVQDDWRVTQRFSANYGVRYELYTPFVEKNNHLANLLINPAVTQVSVAVPGERNPFGGTLPNSLIRPERTDFAPRLGIAWRPLPHGGPVVRAGYGMFYNNSIYDDLYGSMLNQPPWSQSRALVTSATQLLTLEKGFPPSGPSAVTNVYGADPNYRVGYAQIWNLSVEQQFGNNYVLELLYTGTKGTHLDLLEDPNQATPGSIVGSDQRRRIPNASGFNYEASGGNSIYNGFQVHMQKRMSNGIRFRFLYTLGHSIDDASQIGIGHTTALVQDYYNRRAERGNSFFDIRNDVRTWFYYDLPFGNRRQWLRSGIGAKLLGNWHFSANTLLNSGAHLTPYITAQNTNGVGPLFSQRPDQIGNPNLPADQRTSGHYFNVSAFSLPPIDRFGNAARGSIVGPGFFGVNASLGRRMHFGRDDRYQLELRWEVQNVTNTVNFSNVVTVIDKIDAGTVTGPKQMRSMDIFLRLHF
jgi:trimeric autotransporter adhesin